MAETLEHDTGRPPSLTNINILYVMHAVSPFTMWTLSLIAVIVGAIARDNVRGTWVETHYSWLARTFFWGILWFVVVTVVLGITVVGILLWGVAWGVLTIWYLYRVIRGWLRLNDRLPAPT